jgi:putative FmdB family regulatory protein
MPIYVYRCKKCGFEREIISLKPEPDTYDLSCQCGNRMKRAITAGAIHFKGSGWAKDSYGLRSKGV